jgi:hypothetical protein
MLLRSAISDPTSCKRRDQKLPRVREYYAAQNNHAAVSEDHGKEVYFELPLRSELSNNAAERGVSV